MPVMTRKKKQSPSASMAISRVAALVRRRDRTANSAARLAGRVRTFVLIDFILKKYQLILN
jgi:hypothetical protein